MPESASARALVLEQPRRLVLREIVLPDVGDDDALVRLAGGFAFVPGHETVGIIETIGPRAAQRWGVGQGDRIAVEPIQSCRACGACLAGEYRHCTQHGLADMYGFIDVNRAPGLWGGYAEYQYLAPDSIVLPLPDDLDPVLRGLCVAAAAKEAGAGFVMVTGCGPRDAERLALASDFGADLAVDVAVDDPAAVLCQAVGRLADVVVDVTAKAPAAFAQAIELARPAGIVVVAGTRGFGTGAPGFSPDIVVLKELRVIGALGVGVTAFRAALDLLASGRYPFAELPRRCVGLEAAEDLLATMAGEREAVPPVHGVVVP